MSGWKFGNIDNGIRRDYKLDENGQLSIRMSADIGAALDANRNMRNHNDGYSQSRELRRVAHIPDMLRLKWINEEGWDCLNPEYNDRLVKKLNDPDYAYLRTADGNLGYSNGIIR